MNDMFFISAYKQGNTWMFDDDMRGLVSEPFVLGASEVIQKYLDKKGIKDTKNVPLIFSLSPFPNYEVSLTRTKYEYGPDGSPTSAWYVDDSDNEECWLCPAQLKFFGSVADKIYAKIG